MKIKFLIKGNHEDPTGNPIPKIKRTRRQYWTPEAQRYAAWKLFVQQTFIASLRSKELEELPNDILQLHRKKPLKLGKHRARMDIVIYWKNNAHADPENVFGSIADALFENDKNLDGSFKSKISPNGCGLVEVVIQIY